MDPVQIMSSEDRYASPRTSRSSPLRYSTPTDAQRLLQHIRDAQRDTTPEATMSTIAESLFDDDVDDVSVSRDLVTQSLDEILLALVALRDDGTHGTGLMEDVDCLFEVDPSPGTVYPRLHDLESGGTLARHELVQTKQYAIRDEDDAADRIERAMYQHLTVGMFLHAALEDL